MSSVKCSNCSYVMTQNQRYCPGCGFTVFKPMPAEGSVEAEGVGIPSTEVFTEEALRSQEGKEVPLTFENGGPVIGKAVMHYDEESKNWTAALTIDDPVFKGFLRGSMPR